MSPPTLGRLPNEILSLIFRNFCQHCRSESESDTLHDYIQGTRQRSKDPSWYSLDCQALHLLCLTSKNFRDIAQPILYHDFMPGYGDSWRSESYEWGGPLAYFLRTVTQRNDLAAQVRRVYIHPLLVKNLDVILTKGILEQATLGLAISLSEYLDHFPDVGRLEACFCQRRTLFAPLFGILLATLPNLSHLSLQVGHCSLPITPSTLKVAGVSKFSLKNIDISSEHSLYSNGYPMFSVDNHTYGILNLVDNIETLNLHMCGSVLNPLRLKVRIGTLRITRSRMDKGSIRNLLSSWTGLETFVYEAAPQDLLRDGCLAGAPVEDGIVHFEPNYAIRYLYDHRSTLKSLHLDFRNWSLFAHNLPKPISSLRKFTALEDLLLNPSMVYSNRRTERHQLTGVLPPSIRKLQIAGTFGAFLPGLARGLQGLADAACRGDFPHLREVKCDVVNNVDDYALSGSFARANVKFGYEEYPWSGLTALPGLIVRPDLSEIVPPPLPPEEDEEWL
ncbi:hypothetical protein F4811DRAFT_549597 [Daldinia bambusicola]|nr:hypothetical protein F4811DRAFT_549597 [Daldinia bambusicola]